MIAFDVLSPEATAYCAACAEAARDLSWRHKWLFLSSLVIGWGAESTTELATVLAGKVLQNLTTAADRPDKWRAACLLKFGLEPADRRRVDFRTLPNFREELPFSEQEVREIDFTIGHAAALGRQVLTNWAHGGGSPGR